MKNSKSYFRKCVMSVVAILIFLPTLSVAETVAYLHPKLALFSPYLGTWQANFYVKNGNPPVVDVSLWERALNGNAIRTLHSINEGAYGGESLIFYDKSKQKIVFYYFTTAEFFTQGIIDIIDEQSFVAYEEVTGSEEGITQVKSTSQLSDNEMIVSTSYLKNGSWTAAEDRIYKRSDSPVIFR